MFIKYQITNQLYICINIACIYVIRIGYCICIHYIYSHITLQVRNGCGKEIGR